jgi:hypothetical protein
LPPPPNSKTKRRTFRRHGTLNPHPETVADRLFQNSDFFDADGLVQIKYEMLRHNHVDKGSRQRLNDRRLKAGGLGLRLKVA